MDIHNYDKGYQTELESVRNSSISPRNKELLFNFNDALVLQNLSKPRLMRYLSVLRIVAERLGKDFDTATIDDIKRIVSTIQQRSDYSQWTKQTYKVLIRRFYKWLHGTKEYPAIVSWINISISKSQKKLPSDEELLTEKDIQKLLDGADNLRDKAFVSMLWESGCRIGEIGGLCIKNIAFDKYGTSIHVTGKTGPRKMRLVSSTPYIANWLNNHPLRNDKNAGSWVSMHGQHKPLRYGALWKLLVELFGKVGVDKRCNPHIFRHSRATYMANHLTEFQMNQYFGWIQGSDMPSTYVHLSGREVDEAILAMNGIVTEKKKEESNLLPKKCPRCDMINAVESRHCGKCGGILDIRYAMELEEKQKQETEMRSTSDELMNLLLKDKEVQEMLMEKLRNLREIGIPS